MRVWIGKVSKTVKIFLAGCIPEIKFDRLLSDRERLKVVLKDSGDIFFRKFVGCVSDQQTGFTYSSVKSFTRCLPTAPSPTVQTLTVAGSLGLEDVQAPMCTSMIRLIWSARINLIDDQEYYEIERKRVWWN